MTGRSSECVYCGAKGKLTVDHIPPKNLFAEPRPSDLWTVPSCRRCNNQASKDDEYFKMMLTLKDFAGDHPDAKQASASVLRSLQRPEAQRFTRSFLDRVRYVDALSPSGLYVGRRMAYDVNLARLDCVISRVVKGLFYRLKGYRLPSECSVACFSEDGLRNMSAHDMADLQQKIVLPALEGFHEATPREVMSYWASFDPDDHVTSGWILEFYRDVRFLALIILPRDNSRKANWPAETTF